MLQNDNHIYEQAKIDYYSTYFAGSIVQHYQKLTSLKNNYARKNILLVFDHRS